MSVGVASIRTALARLSAAALALPVLLGGGAAPAVVAHAMTPAVGNSGQYQDLGTVEDLGSVHFRCQAPGSPRPCYGPDQIRAAYDIQPLLNAHIDGTGTTIVIIDAFSSPTIQDDLNLFDHVWGLPDAIVDIATPDGTPPFDAGWAHEISLDVEWAHAIAPGAHLQLVLAKSSDDVDLLSATRYAVDNNMGDVITQSFGEAEAAADPELLRQEHAVFERAASKGITLVAGSGDFGATNPLANGSPAPVPSAATPASDPDVTAVGGTQLIADPVTGAYGSESAWSDAAGASGGGFSSVYRRPGYQAQFVASNAARGLPDVAYSAALYGSPVIFFNRMPAGFAGTSVGTPQWAGIVALAQQAAGHRQSQFNIRLYHVAKSSGYGAAFHDITTGNNTFAGVTGFAAGAGWDPVTGLGTPDVAKLVPLLS